MTEIRSEVLEEIDTRVRSFRARGRPLTSDGIDELAKAWLLWKAKSEERPEPSVEVWASLELSDLLDSEPESAIAVLSRALVLAPGAGTEFEVFEELQPLVRKHLQFLHLRLPGLLIAHEGLRARLHQICGEPARPYGWTRQEIEQLCACLGKSRS
jgi:hypothetical protein